MEIFGIGLPEIVIVLVLALIVFGPERLPKIARDLGSTLASFRREAEGIRQEFISSMESVQDPVRDSIQELRSALSLTPARPAPLEIDPPRYADEQPIYTGDETQNALRPITSPAIGRTNAAASTNPAFALAPAKSMPPRAEAEAVDVPLNTTKLARADKQRQASPAKPQARTASELAAPAPTLPAPPPVLPSPPVLPASIEPIATPRVDDSGRIPPPLPEVLQPTNENGSDVARPDDAEDIFANDMLMPFSEAAITVDDEEPAGSRH